MRARTTRDVAVAAWTIAVVALIFLLRAASQLLIPIVLAVLISYALEPVVALLQRWRLPRLAGAGLLLVVVLGLTGWGAYRLQDDVVQAVESLPELARRAREFAWKQGGSRPAQRLQQAAAELQKPMPPIDGNASPTDPSQQAGKPAPPAGNGWLSRAVGSVIALAGHVTVIVFLVFFLLVSGNHFGQRIIEVAGPRLADRRITATIIDDINAQIQRFLLVRLLTSVVVAAATWMVLAWMDVRQAAVWGITAGVFNSIPYFGPVIVSGGLLLVGLMQFGEIVPAIKISAAALVITSLEGWLLTPPLLGKTERMHVVVVFLGVLVWTWIWGAWGTIIAVPMLVIVKAIADRVEPLKPIGRLMAP